MLHCRDDTWALVAPCSSVLSASCPLVRLCATGQKLLLHVACSVPCQQYEGVSPCALWPSVVRLVRRGKSIHPSVRPSIHPSVRPSIHLSTHPPTYLPNYHHLPACLSVCSSDYVAPFHYFSLSLFPVCLLCCSLCWILGISGRQWLCPSGRQSLS